MFLFLMPQWTRRSVTSGAAPITPREKSLGQILADTGRSHLDLASMSDAEYGDLLEQAARRVA